MRQVVRKVLGSSSVKRLSLEFTHSPSTRPERKSHSPQQSSLSVEAPRKKREHSVAEGARIDAFPAQKKRSEKTPTKNSITEPLNSAASASASPDEAPTIPNTASIGRTVAIRRCEYILGYQFQNRFLLWEALHCTEPITPTFMTTERRFAEGNKRLAVVGDRVLDLLLTMKWYHTWEARMSFSQLHERVLSNKNLSRVCMTAGLQEFIIPVTPLSSRSHPKLTSAIVEAIIGAVYLDRGLDAAKKVARGLKIEIYQDFTDQIISAAIKDW